MSPHEYSGFPLSENPRALLCRLAVHWTSKGPRGERRRKVSRRSSTGRRKRAPQLSPLDTVLLQGEFGPRNGKNQPSSVGARFLLPTLGQGACRAVEDAERADRGCMEEARTGTAPARPGASSRARPAAGFRGSPGQRGAGSRRRLGPDASQSERVCISE
jgi:hypothetical protein